VGVVRVVGMIEAGAAAREVVAAQAVKWRPAAGLLLVYSKTTSH